MSTLKLLDYIIRVAGTAALLLGLALWMGWLYQFLNVHMALGIAVVLSVWVAAVIAYSKSAANLGLTAGAVIWGLLTLALGVFQTQILQGNLHWLVQVAHLLMGLGAIALGATLSGKLKRKPSR